MSPDHQSGSTPDGGDSWRVLLEDVEGTYPLGAPHRRLNVAGLDVIVRKRTVAVGPQRFQFRRSRRRWVLRDGPNVVAVASRVPKRSLDSSWRRPGASWLRTFPYRVVCDDRDHRLWLGVAATESWDGARNESRRALVWTDGRPAARFEATHQIRTSKPVGGRTKTYNATFEGHLEISRPVPLGVVLLAIRIGAGDWTSKKVKLGTWQRTEPKPPREGYGDDGGG